MRTLPDPAHEWTEADARAVLEEWRRSGESLAAFARQHGMGPARLYWWRKRLGTSPASRTPTMLSLVPATIVSTGARLTIRLPGEVEIEIANASPSWVAAMVAELTRPTP